MEDEKLRNKMLFKDLEKNLDSLSKEGWTTVYSYQKSNEEWMSVHSAFLPLKYKETALENANWDLRYGEGKPGLIFTFKNGKEKSHYYKYGNDEGIEPIVIHRNFNGLRPDITEISSEFVQYFNLYFDRDNEVFIQFDEDGDEEKVITIKENEVRIKTRLLKEYLNVKKMLLAIYFDIDRFSKSDLSELSIKAYNKKFREPMLTYDIGIRDFEHLIGGEKIKSQSWVNGKKLIEGDKKYKPKLFENNKQYAEFIIGLDDDGNLVKNTCNPDELVDYFGKNKGKPHFLTPIFFSREVLGKYYNNPEKYTVEDGYLKCHGLWRLYIDNNNKDYVSVFLGDLGESLSFKEQLHWLEYNINEKGKISYTNWKRSFESEYTDPEQSDLYFKQKYKSFNKKWKEKFGWDLFLPLHLKDEHRLKTLRIPLSNNQAEFESQVLALAILLNDSINVKQLKKELNMQDEEITPISLLQEYFVSLRIGFENDLYQHLRDIQAIRSTSSAHRKGKDYDKLAKKYSFESKNYIEIFTELLNKSIMVLNSFDSIF